MNTLTITHLNKTYANGVKALHHVTLELRNGMFGLLGPNGAGKSSLIKTLAGLQKADSGTMHFNGVDIGKDPLYIKKQLGFLPQDFGVYPKISAYDLLSHIAVLKGMIRARERKEHVLALLDKVNLYEYRKKEVHTFSGGVRQRFGIAQALLGNPQLVILDEPTAGLDPEERNRFNNFLSQIGEDRIVILSTHLVEDVKNLCTQMGVMHQGSLIAKGNPDDFVQQLEGKLWQRGIAQSERAHYEATYSLLSTQYNTSKLTIRIESDTPPPGDFQRVAPSLEDAYFSLLHRHQPSYASTIDI